MVNEHIKQLRISLGLSQSELARRVGLDRSHLSRVEAGKLPPSDNFLRKIAMLLPVDVKKASQSRQRGKSELFSKRRWLVRAFGAARPTYVQPLRVAFALARHSAQGAALVDWLDGQRFSGAVWTAIKVLAGSMNGLEQKFFLHSLRQGGCVQRAHPFDTNFQLPVVNSPADQPLAIFVNSCVIFPQVTVAVRGYTPRMDFLLAMPGRPPFFVDIEVDGPCHLGRQERDRSRASKIGLTEIRLADHVLERTDFWQYFWGKIEELLAQCGKRWAKRVGRLMAA